MLRPAVLYGAPGPIWTAAKDQRALFRGDCIRVGPIYGARLDLEAAGLLLCDRRLDSWPVS